MHKANFISLLAIQQVLSQGGQGGAVSAKVLQLAGAWNVASESELLRLMLVGQKLFLVFSWRIRKIRKKS